MATAPATLSAIKPFPALSERAAGTYNSKAYTCLNDWATITGPELAALASNVYGNAVDAAESSSAATSKVVQANAAANAAAGSVIAAAAAKTAAEVAAGQAALVSEKYFGALIADPSVNPKTGGPLFAGDWYINTASGTLRAYSGSAWAQSVSGVAGVTSLNGQVGVLNLKTIGGQSLMGDGDINLVGKLPIFGAEANAAIAVSGHENVFGAVYKTGLPEYNPPSVVFANGLFVAVSTANSFSSVATSADGKTWTLRTAPVYGSTAGVLSYKQIATDGTSIMVANGGYYELSKSTDGLNWTSTSALPSSDTCRMNFSPAVVSSRWAVLGDASTDRVYLSDNFGVTWSSHSTGAGLHNPGGGLYTVNGRFVFFTNTSDVRSSTSGESGTWSSTPLPVSMGMAWQDTDGTVCFSGSVVGDPFLHVYKLTSHNTFEALLKTTALENPIRTTTVNGTLCKLHSPTGANGFRLNNGNCIPLGVPPGLAGYGVQKGATNGLGITVIGVGSGSVCAFDNLNIPLGVFTGGTTGIGNAGGTTEFILNIVGTLASSSLLPANSVTGTGYIIDGDLWFRNTLGWANVGRFQGPAGASAYQVAVTNGFVGSETDWLTSLGGADPGAGGSGNGLSAYQVAVANGFLGSETDWLASLVGVQGATPTVTVGSVTTLAAGSPATVTPTVMPGGVALNFGIPQGAAGTGGGTTVPDLSAYQQLSAKGLAGGYAGLGADGKVPAAQLPAASPLPDLSAYQQLSAKGLAGGYAGLGADGKVPAAQLPNGSPISVAAKGNVGSGTVTFNVAVSTYQTLTVTGGLTLSITGWPATGSLGELTVEMENGGSAAVTMPTGVRWLKADGTYTTDFTQSGYTLLASGTNFLCFWTRTAGATVWGRVL